MCFFSFDISNNKEKHVFFRCKWRFLFSIERLWNLYRAKSFLLAEWSLSLYCAVSLSEKENQKMAFVHMKTEQIGT